MEIGRKDIAWNYLATFLKIASSALLLPLILRMMSSEMVGIWTVFVTITAFAGLLDFGFNPSFTRNVSYVFSGVKNLQTTGVETITSDSIIIDYGLLKGLISSMRWLYSRVAIVLFFLLSTLGTFYIYSILQNYTGNKLEVYISWGLLCIINTYNISTTYYDSLLQGKGLIKRSKQIIIVGQSVYLIIAAIFLFMNCGLIAIVSAQVSSVIIIRFLSHYSFFTDELKQKLDFSIQRSREELLRLIYPNAIKVGLTSLGSFLVQKSAIIIGSLYLSLGEIASYGITIQLIGILVGLAGIYFATYQPKIAQLRVSNNIFSLKIMYIKCIIFLTLTFLFGGFVLLLLGEPLLGFIGSNTKLVPTWAMLVALIISFLESNHSIAGGILLTKNVVPFFKASLVAGAITIILLFIMFYFAHMRIWAMILAPGIAHLYNNWKWPYEVHKQLSVTKKDVLEAVKNLFVNFRISKI